MVNEEGLCKFVRVDVQLKDSINPHSSKLPLYVCACKGFVRDGTVCEGSWDRPEFDEEKVLRRKIEFCPQYAEKCINYEAREPSLKPAEVQDAK